VSANGRVDRLALKIEPELFTVPSQTGARDRFVPIDLESEFVALVSRVVLAQSLMENTHEAADFGRLGVTVERPAEVPLGVFEPLAVQSLPGKDQVGRSSPGEGFAEEAIDDLIGALSDQTINSRVSHCGYPPE
jgi:hypothetical protein